MVYYQSHRRENSSSALSFTSSTGSATGASFTSTDDPSGYYSSMLLSLKNIFDSVYRCDSAAVVDGASNCGSVANQALYQGVEVVLKTTTCNKGYGTKNLTDSVKEAVASKPFVEYQCFCDDDDFIVNNEVWRCNTITSTPTNNTISDSAAKSSQHIRAASIGSDGSGECRNERSNPSIAATSLFVATENDDAMRNNAVLEECEEAVTIRRSKWVAHTKNFYSKINSPNQRVVTTLSDITATSISPRRSLTVELVPALVSKIEDDMKSKGNTKNETVGPKSLPVSSRWVPRKFISETREQ
mmetsp:Transcript_5446/g.13681  ORF Transcript_5446/g.13681 Transcript_5446/m.13681 type:complete len:300 (-) Transcript_5446:590-1489(-)